MGYLWICAFDVLSGLALDQFFWPISMPRTTSHPLASLWIGHSPFSAGCMRFLSWKYLLPIMEIVYSTNMPVATGH